MLQTKSMVSSGVVERSDIVGSLERVATARFFVPWVFSLLPYCTAIVPVLLVTPSALTLSGTDFYKHPATLLRPDDSLF